jgi:hypothetical protein
MAMAVPRQQKYLRWLRRGALVLIVCYAALLIYVQVSERVMRHRAERLLATMRELQVGKSGWVDLQQIRTQWGAWGSSQGPCTEERCEYSVSLTDVAGGSWFEALVFYLGHGHLSNASLQVMVERKIVKLTSFHLWVEVPKGYGTRWEREQPQDPGYVPYSSGPYTLMAKASTRLGLEHLCCYWPDPVPHPNYVLTKPGGCTNCLAIWTEFLPQATWAEKLRVTNFNFNCVTKWKPCADEEDIMPEAGAEYEQQRQASMIRAKRQDQCSYSVKELSDAALNAAVVEVESIPKGCSDGLQCVKLRLVKQLAGPATWVANEILDVDASMEGLQGRRISEAFTDRKPLIVLYPDGPKEKMLLPYTCGLLPYSEEAERNVTVGVSLGKGIPESEY